MKRIVIITILLTLVFSVAGCGPGTVSTSFNTASPGQTSPESEQTTPAAPADSEKPAEQTPQEEKPAEQTKPPQDRPRPDTLEGQMEITVQVTITMEDGDVIVAELYPDLAPQSVSNFVSLARDGFYDGLKFHRIMKDFMIQGGCPLGDGTGNPGYSIMGEFSDNGFSNELSHKRGVLSMARSNDFNSAGSQFFIVHGDSEFLDGKYAAFGQVISGMDVVDRLADTPNSGPNGAVAAADMPVIKSITVDGDIELPELIKLGR